MPITAMGSVGEMSAPNTRHQDSGNDSPNIGSSHHTANATINVEAMVPSTASMPTCQR